MKALRKIVRVKKEQSAFFYFILEASEGATAYSTLPFEKGQKFRDIELLYTKDYAGEVENILARLGECIYEIQ